MNKVNFRASQGVGILVMINNSSEEDLVEYIPIEYIWVPYLSPETSPTGADASHDNSIPEYAFDFPSPPDSDGDWLSPENSLLMQPLVCSRDFQDVSSIY